MKEQPPIADSVDNPQPSDFVQGRSAIRNPQSIIHPVTWLVWLAAALTAALTTRNPLYLAIILLAVATVRVAWRGQSPTALGWAAVIRLGLMLWGMTALFDTLSVHQGATVLFVLPDGWLLVGGPITLESLLYGLISGLALTTLLVTFATFNSTVNHHRLLRLTPDFFHQAGLVVSIALVFVPQMMAALQDIREAQRLRGHRFRGVRDLLPLIVPLLGNGLERAIGLAEAMEARGFASAGPGQRGWPALVRRLAVLLSVLAIISGLFATRYWPQRSTAGWAVIVVGAVVFLAVLWRTGDRQKRTRYQPLGLGWHDALVMVTAGVPLTVVGGLALVRPEMLAYNPYPQVTLPAFHPLIGLALLGLAIPALRLSTGARVQESGGESFRYTSPHLSPSRAPQINTPLVTLQNVNYWYPEADAPALRGLTLSIAAGDFVLVMGPSGAGKSTFLRTLNGLVPHFTGGTISGTIRVAGRDPVARGTQGMADVVGFVFQDPEAQFVVDRVEDELVFALENLGYSRWEMEHRLTWVLDVLDLHKLRYRRVDTLSGGERQRVAIGSVLALQPQVLVLDEPTSQLDPTGADDLLAAVTELNRQLGLTVVLAEHRLERVLPYVDRIIYFPDEGHVPVVGRPSDVMQESDLVPPVVELARIMGWNPLPLTVEEAGRKGELRRTWGKVNRELSEQSTLHTPHSTICNGSGSSQLQTADIFHNPKSEIRNPKSVVVLRVSDLWYVYDGSDVPALRGVDLSVGPGEVVAVVGANGAGKTTLLRCIMDLIEPTQGEVHLLGRDVRAASTEELARFVGFVPQNAGAMLFADSVRGEISFTRRSHGLPPDGQEVLEALELVPLAERYPWDLSVGERQRVAMAAFLAAEPELLLLDEPTRGLDYRQKATLASILRQHQAASHAAVVVTHDVELVAAVADRMVILEDGQVIADGPTGTVMHDHPEFASQISRLFQDEHLASVGDVVGYTSRR